MSFEFLLASAYKVLLVSVHFGCPRGGRGGEQKKTMGHVGHFQVNPKP